MSYDVLQQGALETTETQLSVLSYPPLGVMWEHYSRAIQGQSRLFQCTKITQNARQWGQRAGEDKVRISPSDAYTSTFYPRQWKSIYIQGCLSHRASEKYSACVRRCYLTSPCSLISSLCLQNTSLESEVRLRSVGFWMLVLWDMSDRHTHANTHSQQSWVCLMITCMHHDTECTAQCVRHSVCDSEVCVSSCCW